MENLALFFSFLGMIVLTTSAMTVKVNQYTSDFTYMALLEFALITILWGGVSYIIYDCEYHFLQSCLWGSVVGLIIGIGILLRIQYLNKNHYESECYKLKPSSKFLAYVIIAVAMIIWLSLAIIAVKFYKESYIQYRSSQGLKMTANFEIRKIDMQMIFITADGAFQKTIAPQDVKMLEAQLRSFFAFQNLFESDDYVVKFNYGRVFMRNDPYSLKTIIGDKNLLIEQVEQIVQR